MIQKIFSLSLLIAAGSLVGCLEQTPIDIENSKATGSIDSLVIAQPSFASTAGQAVSTGSSPLLLLGQTDHERASFLIKFANFPDSSIIESAKLMLFPFQTLGDTIGQMEATAYRITGAWNEDDVTFDSFSNQFDPAAIARATIVPADSDTVIFKLDPQLVSGWIDSTVENFGIYIRTEKGNFLKQFFSGNSSKNPPILELSFRRRANQDTTLITNALVGADAFVFEDVSPLDDKPFYVSNGDDYRSLLKFDLSAIPQRATINRAILKLTVDSTRSFLSSTDGYVFDIFRLTAEGENPLTVEVDSSQSINLAGGVVLSSTKQLSLDLAPQIQKWSFGLHENYGMLLASRRPNRDLYRVAFYSSKMDSTKAPSLKIYYTAPPNAE